MRYMLVNLSEGVLQVNLFNPNRTHNNVSLNRPGPSVAIRLNRGESVDLLSHFKTLEEAYAHMKFSSDAVLMLSTNRMRAFVCNDNGEELDIEELMGKVQPEPPPPANILVPPAPPPPMAAKDIPEQLKDHEAFADTPQLTTRSLEEESKNELKEDEDTKMSDSKKKSKKK